MKYSKSYQAIVAIVMIIMSWSSITAYDFVVDGIYYNILNHNEAEVTHYYTYPGRDYKGYVGNVIIPNKVVYDGTTYNITAIGVDAFTLSESMTGVQIPNSVSSIGKEAFQNCINLTNIEIPNSVTYIGDFAFDSCNGLTSIEIPNSVTYIGIGAFNECNYLNNIDISDSIKSIEDEVFSRCTRLSSIKIPHGVLRIGTGAFKYCASLTNIEIPISVTDIGQEAFEGCSSLSSIEIPYGLISIEDNVFNWCKNLTSIKIPNSVTSIGDWAFGSCSSLTSIEIPNSVTSIGRGSFEYCSSLTSVDIPNSVTSIGYDAFCSCASLSSIKVPDSIILIRNCAFADCTGLTKVEWNVKFNSNYNLLESIFRGCSNITSFTFGESVEHIPSDICSNLSNLTDIIIGSNVKTIGSNAFKNCTGLTNIEMPNSITSIEFGAFAGCWSLTSIEIPNSVTSIGDYVFARCSSLTSIEIPNSVTSIGDWAFDNCSSLTSIEIPNSVTSIGYSAFSKCSSLTSIQIGNSVTSIGTCVFSDCNSLTSIVVDSGNTKYDSRNDCNAIIKTASNTLIAGCQNTIIPNSVTSIGWYAFAFCTNLKEITCLATTPPAMYVDTFSDYSASLFVPEGYISDYQSIKSSNGFSINSLRDDLHNHSKSFLVDSLVLGYKNAVPENDNKIWTATGIGHVWSISGFHMTLVGGWLFAIFFLIFRSIPYITRRIPARIPALICAWIGLLGYLFISGLDVATIRAFLMTTLVFMAFIFGRNAVSMRNICLAFCLIFLINPHYVMQPGFQLSFSAIFGLIWFWGDINYKKRTRTQKVLRAIYVTAITSIIATIFTAPFVIAHFSAIPIYGLIGNLILLPVFSFAIMPFVLIGACGTTWATNIAHNIYDWTLNIATWISELPAATITVPHVSNTAMVLFIIGLACVIFIRTTKWRENFILGTTFICIGIMTVIMQPHPIFMSTFDNEFVAFHRDDGILEFNMKSASKHYFAFDTFLQISGHPADSTRHKHKCSRGVCEFKSDKITLMYTQRFKPLAQNLDTWCTDDNVDYIVSYLKIDAPRCNHKILRDGFIIYDNGKIEKVHLNRYWHNRRG